MEQLGISEFLDILPESEAEAFELIKPELIKILDINGLGSDEISLKKSEAKNPKSSSVYLGKQGSLVCKIVFGVRKKHILISNKYKADIPAGISSEHMKSDGRFIRLYTENNDDILAVAPLIAKVLDDMVYNLPTSFGCCSKYIECSDAKMCLRKGEDIYKQCFYRRNLRRGKIFYGKNKNI